VAIDVDNHNGSDERDVSDELAEEPEDALDE